MYKLIPRKNNLNGNVNEYANHWLDYVQKVEENIIDKCILQRGLLERKMIDRRRKR